MKNAQTVRIRSSAHEKLRHLAAQENQPMPDVLDRAIDAYYRKKFLEQANAAYDALRRDPGGWKQELAERAEWEQTLGDGLEED